MSERQNMQPAEEPRIAREKKTIEAMIRIYCRHRHGSNGQLCDQCADLRQYALDRLARCPHGGNKPTCAKCPVHCFKRQRREHVRRVMRFAGPRMLPRHPILAIRHQIDSVKPR